MIYELRFTPRAEEDLLAWKKAGQKTTLKKLIKLFSELQEHPRSGTGKPEQLKGYDDELWSRRIDKKNRLIYSIHDEIIEIHVLQLKGHYNDK